jgi:hypothetical protein
MYRDLESELKNGESRAQASITVLHTRTVIALPRFCRKIKCASNRDELEGIRKGIFFHADQHEQPRVDVLKLRAIEGGRRAGCVSNRDEKKGIGSKAFFHAD